MRIYMNHDKELVFEKRKKQPDSCPKWKDGIGDCESVYCAFCEIEAEIKQLESLKITDK
mgnify:CR=1 FL=1